jgi:hypothetical protein
VARERLVAWIALYKAVGGDFDAQQVSNASMSLRAP